jgi:uncharacterized protein
VIVEGVATTWDLDGVVNVAPLGPLVPERPPSTWKGFLLRPFPGSRTYANLKATGEGVFHLTDDVLLIARSAVGDVTPVTVPAEHSSGRRLADCCRWFEFRIGDWNETGDRPQVQAIVLHQGVGRDWAGFNRAKHAVLEAAILATRLHLLGKAAVGQELERLKSPIEKTAGAAEREAFQLLIDYVQRWRPS